MQNLHEEVQLLFRLTCPDSMVDLYVVALQCMVFFRAHATISNPFRQVAKKLNRIAFGARRTHSNPTLAIGMRRAHSLLIEKIASEIIQGADVFSCSDVMEDIFVTF